MKIMKPSAHIMSELDNMSIPQRVEQAARICYKSENRISETSAGPFIQSLVRNGHHPCLEFSPVTLLVCGAYPVEISEFFFSQPKYLHTTLPEADGDNLIISGSIRAFKDLALSNPGHGIASCCAEFLSGKHPDFFHGLSQDYHYPGYYRHITVEKVPLETLSDDIFPERKKHRHVAVKFIVNRAVSHELCRHRPVAILMESQRYCRYSGDKFGNEVSFIKPMFFEEGTPEYKVWVGNMLLAEVAYLELLKAGQTPQAARTVLPNSCKTELIMQANLEEWEHILNLRCPSAAEPSMREIMIPLEQEFSGLFGRD